MSRGKKILIFSGIGMLLIVVIVIVIVHFLNAPSVGKVVTSSQTVSTNTAPTFDLTPVKEVGNYVTFSYPTSMQVYNNSPNQGSYLEHFLYKYPDASQTWVLAITVNKLNLPNLTADSSYNLRISQPNNYQESKETIGSKNFVIFKQTNVTGFSQAAFIQNGTESADISLTGDDIGGLANLQSTFDLVLNSFNWK